MSRTEQIEIERKYDVADLVRVPDLAGIGPVVSTTTREAVALRAVYFDTAEHLLLGSRITLRRREGGPDQGWHVKLPLELGARREVHSPLGSEADEPVPSALRHVVEVVLRGRPVHPVLILETTRTVTDLLDADGERLGELADDEVTATRPDVSGASGGASPRTWREWEVELAEGVSQVDGEALQDAVADALERAGASASASKSKLARGLGPLPQIVPLGDDAGDPARLPPKSAAAFLVATLSTLVDELKALDAPVRDSEDDAVHRFRTTIRRLRSVLRVYRGIVDPDECAWLDAGLARVGSVAGVSRDLEVTSALVEDAAASAPAGFVEHQAVGRLQAGLREASSDSAHDFERILTEPDYFELLDRLDGLASSVPTGPLAEERSKDVVATGLGRERKRARKRLAAAVAVLEAVGAGGKSPDGAAESYVHLDLDLDTVHAARKAVRRLRYALEAALAAGIVPSSDSKTELRIAHAIQDAFGDALDAHAAAAHFVTAADRARWAGEDTFSYGVLATVASRARDEAFAQLPSLVREL